MVTTIPLADDWPFASVFMQLDVRAVYDSNGDGIGDLPGLAAKLDHFQEVGVGALHLVGTQPSDLAYGGTMLTDFYSVEPKFGTLADFDRLVEAAHARGIAILITWSPFSTHPDHPYFLASRDPLHPDHADFRDYYLWTEDVNTRLPRRWGHWEWDERRGAYHHTVWLTTDLRWCPEVNLLSARARAENEKALRFWLDRGVDGFMIDCAVWGGFTSRADHVAFSQAMTAMAHGYPGRKWLISEGSRSIQEAIVTDGYDSFFSNQARSVPVYATAFRKPGLGDLVEFFPGMESHGIHEALLAYYDDEHGHQIMNMYDPRERLDLGKPEDVARAKLAHALHLSLPLIPYAVFPSHTGFTPAYHQRLTTWHPFVMLWDEGPNFGFTTGTPFAPQNVEGYPASAHAAAQLRDPNSILWAFREVAQARQAHPALQSRGPAGETYARVPTSDDRNHYAYMRYHPESGEAIAVVTNLLGEARTLTLDLGRSRRAIELARGRRRLVRLVGGGPERLALDTAGQGRLELPPFGYAYYDLRDEDHD